MNNYRYIISLIVVLLTSVSSLASSAEGDMVYAKDVTIASGGIVYVPIYLKNPGYAVKSLQLVMQLPDGISFVDDGKGGHEVTPYVFEDWTITLRTQTGAGSNTSYLTMYNVSDATAEIPAGKDTLLFTITLSVAQAEAVGVKEIAMSHITITDAEGKSHALISGSQTTTSKLTVSNDYTGADLPNIVYAKDAIAVKGSTIQLPICLKNPDYAVKALQFVMQLPRGMSFVEDGKTGHMVTRNDLTADWTIHFQTQAGQAENTGYFMMYSTDATATIPSAADIELCTITLKVDDDATAGARSIILNCVSLTDQTGQSRNIIPKTSTLTSIVTVRDTVAEKISGTIYQGSTTALPGESLATFRECLARYPNAVFVAAREYAAMIASLTADVRKNVIYTTDGNAYYCDNLVINDLQDFYSPIEFTATVGSYIRTGMIEGAYTSVCLPFQLTTGDIHEADIYTLTQVSSDYVRFTRRNTIAPGTPCWLKWKTNQDLAVNLAGRKICGEPITDGLARGSFTKQTIGAGKYKINKTGDKFGRTATATAIIYPFRTYIDPGATAKQSILNALFDDGIRNVIKLNAIIAAIIAHSDNLLYDLNYDSKVDNNDIDAVIGNICGTK